MASKQQHGPAAEFILKADIREQWHSAKVKNNDYAVKVQKKMIWLSMLKKNAKKKNVFLLERKLLYICEQDGKEKENQLLKSLVNLVYFLYST